MTVECPVCGRPADPAFRPFCSRGCKDRDLLRWLDEGYRIPGPVADPDLPAIGGNERVDSGVDKGRDRD